MMPWLQRIDAVLRQPLTLTLLGFVLSGVLGTYITTLLHEAEAERSLADSRRDRGIAAIREIAELVNERRTRAVMVSSAIKRGSPDEVVARKVAYDDVYVRWNTREDSILNPIQEFLKIAAPAGDSGYINDYAHSFRTAMTSDHATGLREGTLRADRSRGGLLSQMDDCITTAFDDYRRTRFADPEPARGTLKECRFDDLDDSMIDCIHTLTEQLYSIINHFGDAGRARSGADPFRQNIWAIQGVCSLPSR